MSLADYILDVPFFFFKPLQSLCLKKSCDIVHEQKIIAVVIAGYLSLRQ
jgi:hypothetical protein